MTDYIAIANGDVDQDSPITQTLVTALRDNPVAIAEGDASVPASLRNSVLLGTLTTTSGSTQTLASLDLTNYRWLLFVIDGVSLSGTTGNFYIGVAGLRSSGQSSSGDANYGWCFIDLPTGVGVMFTSGGTADGTGRVAGAASGYSTATTSVSVTASAGTFDAGQIKVYGVK